MRLSRAVFLEWKAETLTATRSLRLTDLIRSAGLGTRLTPGCNSPTLWHPRLPNNSPLTDGSNRAGLSVVQIVHLTLITVRGRGTLCTAKLTNQADCLVLLFCLGCSLRAKRTIYSPWVAILSMMTSESPLIDGKTLTKRSQCSIRT